LQLAQTFIYTAFSKFTKDGNWLTDNPYYYLMRASEASVVRPFPGKEWLAQYPDVCYALGVTLIVFELIIPLCWFIPRARAYAIGLGMAFQAMLLVTLHVPTLFFFLFPPQMLLFIPPEKTEKWLPTTS